jgi:hypothetical protein
VHAMNSFSPQRHKISEGWQSSGLHACQRLPWQFDGLRHTPIQQRQSHGRLANVLKNLAQSVEDAQTPSFSTISANSRHSFRDLFTSRRVCDYLYRSNLGASGEESFSASGIWRGTIK